MTAHSHKFVEARDEFARRPGDETHPQSGAPSRNPDDVAMPVGCARSGHTGESRIANTPATSPNAGRVVAGPLGVTAGETAHIPEWRMTSAQWIAHQERLYGQGWRAEFDRMDGEAADVAFHEWCGGEAYDAAPDLTAASRSVAMMPGSAGL